MEAPAWFISPMALTISSDYKPKAGWTRCCIDICGIIRLITKLLNSSRLGGKFILVTSLVEFQKLVTVLAWISNHLPLF